MAKKKNEFSPTFEQLMSQAEQRSIRASVAMYTIRDLVCAGKIPLGKGAELEDFYSHVQTCYNNLREISAGEASMKQKQKLSDLLRTSTIEHDEAEYMYYEIMNPMFSWKDFKDMLFRLEGAQVPVTDTPGRAKTDELNNELDKQGK